MVVPLGFLFAQLTHFSFFPRDLMPAYLYYPMVIIGIPGVLVLLQFAQLTPQLLAEEQSISFLVSGMGDGYSLHVKTNQPIILFERLFIHASSCFSFCYPCVNRE
jgi:hypothetical protein